MTHDSIIKGKEIRRNIKVRIDVKMSVFMFEGDLESMFCFQSKDSEQVQKHHLSSSSSASMIAPGGDPWMMDLSTRPRPPVLLSPRPSPLVQAVVTYPSEDCRVSPGLALVSTNAASMFLFLFS